MRFSCLNTLNKNHNVHASLLSAESFLQPSIRLSLPVWRYPRLGVLLDKWEPATLHLVESNTLRELHTTLHKVMVDAIISGYFVLLVDNANCFNPHNLDEIAYNSSISTIEVLEQIKIARPFQMFQTQEIVNNLTSQLSSEKENLVVVTSVSELFLEPAINSELDQNNYMLLSSVVGTLKKLALNNATVILTDNLNRKIQSRERVTPEARPVDIPKSLAYGAKVHLQLHTSESGEFSDRLLAHPYKERNSVISQKLDKSEEQLTLIDFFD